MAPKSKTVSVDVAGLTVRVKCRDCGKTTWWYIFKAQGKQCACGSKEYRSVN